MIFQSFHGELYIEDPHLGKQMLYAAVFKNDFNELKINLHNAPAPLDITTLVGEYGDAWTLKKVQTKLLVTVYELTFLHETPNVKARCLSGHEFGRMLENAIKSLST